MRKKIVLSVICWCMTFLHFELNAQNTWTKKADYFTQIANGVGYSIGSKGYIITGRGGGYSNLNYEYDPSTDVWTQRQDFPSFGRENAVGFSIGSKGYVGTGYDGSYNNDFYEYDPATNSWTTKTSFPGAGREFAVGFSIGSKGYLGTGSSGTNSQTKYKDFYEYNPATDSWTAIDDFPELRFAATAFVIGSKGYVVAGRNGSNVHVSELYEYDPSTTDWVQRADYLGGYATKATAFSIGTRGYVGTGYYPYYPLDNGTLSYFASYDQAMDKWKTIAPYGGGATASASAFTIGSKGYVGTGHRGPFSIKKYFYEYDPYKLFTGAISGTTFCNGSTISVPFTSADIIFNSGNVFTAQLSNSSGSFASPTNIGTLTSTATNGTISATIPSSLPTGYNYRVRVVSSNTATTGDDNWTNLTIMGDDFPWSGDVWTSRDQSIILQDDRQDWNYICENSDVHFNAGAASPSDYSIYASTLSNTPYWDGYNMTFTMDPGAWVVFSVNVTVNGCPKTLHYTFFPTNCDYSMYSLAPNPTTSDLVIYVDDEKLKKQKIKSSPDQVIQQVVISDKLGNVLRQQKYPSNTKKIRINVSGLAPDMYVAKIFNGKNWTTIKFMKK
jgi:N-acetylneuraminic acid mutarotase